MSSRLGGESAVPRRVLGSPMSSCFTFNMVLANGQRCDMVETQKHGCKMDLPLPRTQGPDLHIEIALWIRDYNFISNKGKLNFANQGSTQLTKMSKKDVVT